MYKVLLADDEPHALASLQASIPWGFLDLEVAALANNGLEVLDVLDRQEIDMIITDIQMPGMDGLELCRQAQEKHPHIPIILTSGHADFSYAQSAIEYGVLGYCLKPIDSSALCANIKKACLKIDRRRQKKQNPSLAQAFGEEDEPALARALEEAGLQLASYHLALSIGGGDLGDSLGAKATLPLGRGRFLYFLQDGKSLEERLDRLAPEAFGGLAHSPAPERLADLEPSIEQLQLAAYGYWMGQGKVFASPFSWQDGAWMAEAAPLFQRGDETAIGAFLSHIPHAISIKCAMWAGNNLPGLLSAAEGEDGQEEPYFYSFEQLTHKYASFDQMRIELQKRLQAGQATSMPSKESGFGSGNSNFLKIVQYIGQHYTKDISLISVADALSLNPSYVSQLFKKESGITYTKYLSALRIDKAKELLLNTNLSLAQISEAVGFNDYFYFLKIFKKATGISPGKYLSKTDPSV